MCTLLDDYYTHSPMCPLSAFVHTNAVGLAVIFGNPDIVAHEFAVCDGIVLCFGDDGSLDHADGVRDAIIVLHAIQSSDNITHKHAIRVTVAFGVSSTDTVQHGLAQRDAEQLRYGVALGDHEHRQVDAQLRACVPCQQSPREQSDRRQRLPGLFECLHELPESSAWWRLHRLYEYVRLSRRFRRVHARWRSAVGVHCQRWRFVVQPAQHSGFHARRLPASVA